MSTGKKLAFSLIGFVLLPLLVLGLVEAGLRLAGYGYSTSFFKPVRIGNEQMLVDNDKFGLRFFPPELARSPAPVVMKAHKAPGTYRIFILGESAALGDPRPAFGAGRYLEKLLADRYAGAQFEVVCTAMTAINSHAILPVARECARHDGDLWIIYMGNNEMVGPFGAASVFGSKAPSATYARFILAVQQTRLGQLLMSGVRKVVGRSSGLIEWGGMSMFLQNKVSPTDPRKQTVYKNFSRNLEDILSAAHRCGARVLLNTVMVNLKDCAPFASVSGLSGDAQANFETTLSAGRKAESEQNQAEALRLFQQAARLAPQDAEAQFRLGRALLLTGETVRAAEHLEQARDLDALPFRTDAPINRILRAAAARNEQSGVLFFDAARWLATNAPAGLPGNETFYEHVHLDFDGNYRLGRAWAEQVAALLPASLTNGARAAWATQDACERKLGLTDWNREAVYVDVLRRLAAAPFTNQSNHEEQLKVWQTRLAEIRKRLDVPARQAAQDLYAEALQAAPNEHRLHENLAEFLEATGKTQLAAEEWERVRQLLPHHHVAYYHCGRLAMRLGKLPEAEKLLTQAVELRPDLAEGWLNLGQLQAMQGKHDLALKYYERERTLVPNDERVHYSMGKACSNLGRAEEAIAHFNEALRLRPKYWEAHYALGEELAFAGQTGPARLQFEEVLRLKPDYPMAHFNLAVALLKSGQREAGLRELEETQRLDPQNKQAAEYLAKLKSEDRPK